jgi:hypothetical protein
VAAGFDDDPDPDHDHHPAFCGVRGLRLTAYVRNVIFIRMRPEATVKKTYNLPPRLVQHVKKILRAKTETEAIVRSLQEVAFMDELERAVRSTAAKLPRYKALR